MFRASLGAKHGSGLSQMAIMMGAGYIDEASHIDLDKGNDVGDPQN